jgi:hypothetical protein
MLLQVYILFSLKKMISSTMSKIVEFCGKCTRILRDKVYKGCLFLGILLSLEKITKCIPIVCLFNLHLYTHCVCVIVACRMARCAFNGR